MRIHEDRIFSVCLRIMGDRERALDATQETFLTVFRKAGQFQGKSQVGTWIYRIAVNTCYDQLRKAKRRPSESLPDYVDPADPSAESVIDSAGLRPEIETALATLPPGVPECNCSVGHRRLVDARGGRGVGCSSGNGEVTGLSWTTIARQRTREPFDLMRTIKKNAMHRHDLELIAALADGSLEDETFARERVETCYECRAEFKAQSAAIAALATVASATNDRAREGSPPQGTSGPNSGQAPPPKRLHLPHGGTAWSYAAAGLFVVVGLVAVLTQVNGGGDAATEALSVDETIAASADDGGDLPRWSSSI